MIYKLNFKTIFFKLLLATVIFSGLFFYSFNNFKPLTYTILFILIIGLEVIIFFFNKFLVEIVIKNEESLVILHFKKNLIKDSFLEISFDELFFSFKRETGARGVKAREFRLYNVHKKIIVRIGKGFDGWEEKILNQLVDDLKKLNIREIK